MLDKTPLHMPECMELRSRLENELENKCRVSVQAFIELDPMARLVLVRDSYSLTNLPPLDLHQTGRTLVDNGYGILVVKPEMYDLRHLLTDFLSTRLQITVEDIKDFTFSPDAYWWMYGRDFFAQFDEFPHGALLLLIAITLNSSLILFKHKSMEEYRQLYSCLNPGKDHRGILPATCEDRQSAFSLIVKSAGNSLRNLVVLPEVEKKGLLTMVPEVQPDIYWDFTGSFRQRTVAQNIRTFNGVHSPRDWEELAFNIVLLSSILHNQSNG